jgi:hypothetical protein
MRVPSRLTRVLGSSWFLGALVGLAGWPLESVVPGLGLDASWGTALNLAAAEGLDFGGDVVWTYGPLGFLKVPQVSYGTHAVLGAAYTIAVQIALGTTLVWSARRTFPLLIAVAIALLAAMLLAEQIVAVALVWCIVVLGDDAPPAASRLFPIAAGIVSAIELLGKLNIGLLVVSMCAVAVVAIDGARRRNVLTFAASLVAALAVSWFGTGQDLGDVGDLVSASAAIVTGYSTAMGSEDAPGALYAWDVALLGASIVAAYIGSRDLPLGRRVATLIVVALAGYVLWKQAVVRHEYARSLGLFTLLVGSLVGFAWRDLRPPRPDGTRFADLVVIGTIVAAAALYFQIAPARPGDLLDPIDHADRAVTQVRDLLIPAERTRARDSARFGLAVTYAVDQETSRLVGDNSVHVEPWEESIAWAYDLEWRPAPVFQAYQAYTSELDQRNADALSSDDGPRRILRHAVAQGGRTLPPSGFEGASRSALQGSNSHSIDGRYGPYDAPATTLAMLCHFEALRTSRAYQVLGRVPDRCGEPRPLLSLPADYGEPIEVPQPPRRRDVVIARVHGLEPSGIERLRTFLFRAAARVIVFDERVEYRIVPGTATGGLIISAAPRVDFPRPFAVAPNARTIEFRKESNLTSPDAELTVEFFALRVRSPS